MSRFRCPGFAECPGFFTPTRGREQDGDWLWAFGQFVQPATVVARCLSPFSEAEPKRLAERMPNCIATGDRHRAE